MRHTRELTHHRYILSQHTPLLKAEMADDRAAWCRPQQRGGGHVAIVLVALTSWSAVVWGQPQPPGAPTPAPATASPIASTTASPTPALTSNPNTFFPCDLSGQWSGNWPSNYIGPSPATASSPSSGPVIDIRQANTNVGSPPAQFMAGGGECERRVHARIARARHVRATELSSSFGAWRTRPCTPPSTGHAQPHKPPPHTRVRVEPLWSAFITALRCCSGSTITPTSHHC